MSSQGSQGACLVCPGPASGAESRFQSPRAWLTSSGLGETALPLAYLQRVQGQPLRGLGRCSALSAEWSVPRGEGPGAPGSACGRADACPCPGHTHCWIPVPASPCPLFHPRGSLRLFLWGRCRAVKVTTVAAQGRPALSPPSRMWVMLIFFLHLHFPQRTPTPWESHLRGRQPDAPWQPQLGPPLPFVHSDPPPFPPTMPAFPEGRGSGQLLWASCPISFGALCISSPGSQSQRRPESSAQHPLPLQHPWGDSWGTTPSLQSWSRDCLQGLVNLVSRVPPRDLVGDTEAEPHPLVPRRDLPAASGAGSRLQAGWRRGALGTAPLAGPPVPPLFLSPR